MHTSARNEFAGTLTNVTKGAVNAEVILDIGGGLSLVAIITNASVDSLGLAAGKPAVALIKAPWVILTTNDHLKTSARNRLCGSVVTAREGAVNAEVTLDIGEGKKLTAIVTNDSLQSLGLKVGVHACALIKASHIILAISA